MPTEAEWQYAAQGRDGRPYPWGTKMEPGRCNDKLNRTTLGPGLSRKGASPFGVLDMVGNVWQMMDDVYDNGVYRYGHHPRRQLLRARDERVVRQERAARRRPGPDPAARRPRPRPRGRRSASAASRTPTELRSSDEALALHGAPVVQDLRHGPFELLEIARALAVAHMHQDDGRGPDPLDDELPAGLVLEEERVEEGDIDPHLFPGYGREEGKVGVRIEVSLVIDPERAEVHDIAERQVGRLPVGMIDPENGQGDPVDSQTGPFADPDRRDLDARPERFGLLGPGLPELPFHEPVAEEDRLRVGGQDVEGHPGLEVIAVGVGEQEQVEPFERGFPGFHHGQRPLGVFV
ncbi:MAG: formylglycine-generating enzyme family protein [Desulfosudis oleivorans]|nr:formylglycine-generating enzyme family protein [Desulfosudis oleivorans]